MELYKAAYIGPSPERLPSSTVYLGTLHAYATTLARMATALALDVTIEVDMSHDAIRSGVALYIDVRDILIEKLDPYSIVGSILVSDTVSTVWVDMDDTVDWDPDTRVLRSAYLRDGDHPGGQSILSVRK